LKKPTARRRRRQAPTLLDDLKTAEKEGLVVRRGSKIYRLVTADSRLSLQTPSSALPGYVISPADSPHGARDWTNLKYEVDRVKSKYPVERAEAAIVALYSPRPIRDMINQSDLHRKVNALLTERGEKPVSRGTVVDAWERLREANSR
jgi:hypothetical protein